MAIRASSDLVGKRFNRLLVISLNHMDKRSKSYWKCMCDCGKEVIVRGTGLQSGDHQSCGCYQRELASKMFSKPDGVAAFNKILSDYRSNAARRNISFELSEDYLREIMSKDCYYCGNKPNNISRSRKNIYVYNGIDRLDSSKGYTFDNIVPCCKWCNYSKRERTTEEFRNWIKQIYLYQNKRRLYK